MNARRYPYIACLSQARLALSAVLGLLLASTQPGCCCFECIEHGTAPLQYVPHRSALTPRNPPCSYVDPLCYGYHATCWRSWSAECTRDRDCLEWCQQDALPIPAKGDMAPTPPAPEASPAPARTPPPQEPQEEAEIENSTDTQVRHAADYEALPPIVTPERVLIRVRDAAAQDRPQHSSRRTTIERLPRVELP